MMHLRIRTEYTFKQVFGPIPKVVARLNEVGATHAAIVDRDGTWGHVSFHAECRTQGVVPILGVELTVSETEDVVTSMFFLARNAEGLRELYRFSSKAYRQRLKTKFGGKPRLFKTDVRHMSENIYIFAGDVLDEDFLSEVNAICDLNPGSRVLNMAKQGIAERRNLRIVHTDDNWYPGPDDKPSFELIEGRVKPSKQYIDTLPHTDTHLTFENYDLPRAPDLKKEGNLEELCRAGAEYRRVHQGLVWDERYEKRLRREVDLILAKKFESYFFIVSDIVQYAKTRMLVGPSRGSSAGSLVCYLLRITEIDPVFAKLYFERFIDESRKDLPDIDIDFPGLKRHIIAEYMQKEYQHVAHIGTVQRYKAKSAMLKTCKTLGIPPIATYAVKAAIITRTSGDARGSDSLQETLDTTEAGAQLLALYPDIRRACELESHASHTGTHAAGLLVCNEPIENFCTVMDDGTAQVEKRTCEALNLLKIDALGLRTLDLLEDCRVSVDWYAMKLTDPRAYEIFNKGWLSGIFQFEGQSLRNLSSQITFKTVDEIDNVVALARPGPFGGGVTAEWLKRRNGEEYKTFHPIVEEHMKDTFGLPIYQEQTMAIVREIGQFDWTQVSSIRKAVSLKKGKEFFDQYFHFFLKGALAQGMTEEEAHDTWEYINSMGAYQMNKAHTYSYATISYWCAWLKAYHPVEFAAANLRHSKDEESAIGLLQEMMREGLPYEPFSVSKSDETWSVRDGVLIAGFDSLRGFGKVKAQKFVEARNTGKLTASQIEQANKADSPFKDLFPMHTKFCKYYDPVEYATVAVTENSNLAEPCVDIRDLEKLCHNQEVSVLFLGRMIQKNLRDANEAVNLKKRNGKRVLGNPMFLDIRFADDTGNVQVRIDTKSYLGIGKPIFEAPMNSIMLIRAWFRPNIHTFGFVQKIMILEKPVQAVKAEKVPKEKREKFVKQAAFRFEEEADG